jgi:hypothetical protein
MRNVGLAIATNIPGGVTFAAATRFPPPSPEMLAPILAALTEWPITRDHSLALLDIGAGRSTMAATLATSVPMAIVRILDDPLLRERLATGGLESAASLDWNRAILPRLVALYERMLGMPAEHRPGPEPMPCA